MPFYHRSFLPYYPEYPYYCSDSSSDSSSGSDRSYDLLAKYVDPKKLKSNKMNLSTMPINTPEIFHKFLKKSKAFKKSAVLLKATSTNQSVLTQSQIDDITGYINNYRSINNAPPLTWDPTIGVYSQNWANYLLANNLFQHSGSSQYGENLAYFKGYSGDTISLLKLAVDMWYNEIKLYDFKNPGFSETTGHFTALVWKSSTSFGMGFAINPVTNVVDITMNTSPPGNVLGDFENNVLEPSTPTTVPVETPVPVIVPNTPNNITPTPAPVPIPGNSINTQPGSSSSTTQISFNKLKANIIHSLYDVINELNMNISKKVVINHLNGVIMDIVNV